MDSTYDGMQDDTGYSDASIPSSTTSTPGTGIDGRRGGTATSEAAAAASAGAPPENGREVEEDKPGELGTAGLDEGGGHGGATNASHGGSRPGSTGTGSRLRVQLPASCDPPLPDTPTKPLVWIVFGGTGHMGRSLVKSAVAHGDYVTMVGRTHETSMAAMQALAASAAEHAPDDGSPASTASTASRAQSTVSAGGAAGAGVTPDGKAKKVHCLGALCDVRVRESVDRVVQRTLAQFGRIDVVANCSGYGVVGACEDQDEHELRNQFETNFMGTLHILQATLPILRRQQELMLHQQQVQGASRHSHDYTNSGGGGSGGGGRYLIFSSTAGALGVPGLGPYCATKYAVEGLIEAMLYEVDAFNIKATLVEPGLMRRDDRHDWEAGDGLVEAKPEPGRGVHRVIHVHPSDARSSGNRGDNANPLPTWGHFLIKPPSEPYANASAPSLHATRMVQWLGDRQPASVVQCAELVWQLAHCSFPPLRLPLGSYAIESIRDRMRSVTEEIEDWKHLNFPLPPDTAAATGGGGGGSSGGSVAASAPASTSTSAAPTSAATMPTMTTMTTTTSAAGENTVATTFAEASSDNKDDQDEEML